MEHGMNCPHHADKDEACTCALTERTMHAAWRKRAEEAEARIAALEAQVKALTEERDAQAEAVGVIKASRLHWMWYATLLAGDCASEGIDMTTDEHRRGVKKCNEGDNAVNANPIARTAVEGGKRED